MLLIWTPISMRGRIIAIPLDIMTLPVASVGRPGKRVYRSCVMSPWSNHVSTMKLGTEVEIVNRTGSNILVSIL